MHIDHRLAELFAVLGDGAWAVDDDGRIILWNERAEELLGYRREDVVGKPCQQVFGCGHSNGNGACRSSCVLIDEVRAGQTPSARLILARDVTGRSRQMMVSTIPVRRNGSGELAGLIQLFQNTSTASLANRLRIQLLGKITVRGIDNKAIDGESWRRAKVRGLLAFLLLQHEGIAHRDSLLEALWPNVPYDKALPSLNTAVYNLRRSLEPALERVADSCYVQVDGDFYVLRGAGLHSLDVRRFEDNLDQARGAVEPERALLHFRNALEQYRGDFASDLARFDFPWADQERTRLRARYLDALEAQADLLAAKEPRAASDLLLRLMSQDPCRESACRALMRLALSRGERAAALTHFERLAAALRRELDERPSPETYQLYRLAQATPLR